MHNDAHDEIDELPKLTTERKEPQLNTSTTDNPPFLDSPLAAPVHATVKSGSNKAIGALSALTIAILCSASAFAWWSMQRMQLLEQQLIATQNSFSKISEDATGRINAITGKVSAAENSVLSGNETLKMRLNSLESSAVDTQKKLQADLNQYSANLTENTSRLSKFSGELTSLTERSSRLQTALKEQKTLFSQQEKTLVKAQSDFKKRLDTQQQQLQGKIDAHQQQLSQLDELNTRLNRINKELSAVQKNTAAGDDITRIQQDILILRSELDNRPTPKTAAAPSLADFDAYRAQTNRTISALQEQVRRLQKNTP